MTQRFILDENVLILAQKGENDGGESDPTCLDAFTRIVTICHTIVVDTNLWGKYQHQLSTLGGTGAQAGSSVLATLVNAARISGKVDFRPDSRPFPEEAVIPQGSQDDVPIVRLAVETGATLVTTDRPLRNGLNSSSVQQQYNLRVLSPQEALRRL